MLTLAAALAMILASTHRIPISGRSAVTVTVGISFATILLLGTALATWSTALGMSIGSGYLSLYRKRWKWYTGAFNVATYIITTAASALVYHTISGSSGFLLLSLESIVALVSAGTAYFLTNAGLVAGVVALREHRDFKHIWTSLLEQTAPEYITLILLAVLTAIVYDYHKMAVFLIILPIVIVYHSLQTSQELRVQTIDAVQALADTIDNRDPYTFEHSKRVAEYAKGTARELALPPAEIETIRLSARVHDLGKVGINDEVLQKPGKLTSTERSYIEQHVRIGAEILERFPRYKEGRDIILYHHERYDGEGYLAGLRGDEIPMGSRIIAVADAYDAMTTDRPYREALSHDMAVDELKRHSGSQFDPVVVGAFLKYLDRRDDERDRVSKTPATSEI